MKANEKIVVSSYVVERFLDEYINGEDTCSTASRWTGKDVPVEGSFNSIHGALEAICQANRFTYKPEAWVNCYEYGDAPGRFDFSMLVREDNTEADADDIEQWKKGKRKLWVCDIFAYLVVRAERELAKEELNNI